MEKSKPLNLNLGKITVRYEKSNSLIFNTYSHVRIILLNRYARIFCLGVFGNVCEQLSD